MDELRKLTQLCEGYSTPAPPLLTELERETHLTTVQPQMLCGHLQGRFLSLLSRLIQPICALEIGTFTGYSAICLAEGLHPTGKLYTIEANPEYEAIVRKYIAKAGYSERIWLIIGDACKVIPELDAAFDLVFIDAGKKDNALFYGQVIDKVRPGGLIIVDNVLWRGKLASNANDPDTRSIANFNKKVQADRRVASFFLPLRDGLLLARKNHFSK